METYGGPAEEIFISPKEVKQFPEFENLLRDLFKNHITSDCVSVDVSVHLSSAQTKLKQSKKQYNYLHLLFTQTNDLLFDFATSPPSSSSEKDKVFYELLKRSLRVAEAIHTGPLPFGLDSQFLREVQIGDEDSYKQQIAIMSGKLMRKLEARLNDKVESISYFYDDQTQKKEVQLERGWQMNALISHQKLQLENQLKQLEKYEINNTYSFWQYYELLHSLLSTLHHIILTFQLKPSSTSTSTSTSSSTTSTALDTSPLKLSADRRRLKLDALKLQLEILDRQLCQDTYGIRGEGADPMKAMNIIRRYVQEAIQTSSSLFHISSMKKSQYENLGMGFPQLASEYGRITKEISNKEWTISQLENYF
eukprot:TRINITY_DN6702_c0_g1_i1.p1 TRINITY_DN6702_c0_g1~~TRINITY_DN6702_c0_g1_i1.p1  ORF type:complete len:365 (-),score=88.83 TRINITY_DN6702_c0_g1_i1:92-1186(-)